MRILPVLLVFCALAACNRPAAEAPAATVQAAEAEAPAVDPNCDFCADPGFVRTCEIAQGVRTTLRWNVADEVTANVGIYVVDDAGKDSPFAEQPPQGSIETGPWLKPGLTFKLKDSAGNVLHSLVIEGKGC